MKKIVVLGLLALGMGGCVSARDEANARMNAQVDADRAECVSKFKAGQVRGYAGYMQCLNIAEAPLSTRLRALGYGDLTNVRDAGRLAIAERVDRGEITPAQADFEIAQLNSNVLQSANNRRNANRLVNAATSPVTCNRFGNSVTCF